VFKLKGGHDFLKNNYHSKLKILIYQKNQ